MTTYLGKSCSFCLPRVPFINCRQFMYLVISLLVLRAGYGIRLYQFLIIAYLFTLPWFDSLLATLRLRSAVRSRVLVKWAVEFLIQNQKIHMTLQRIAYVFWRCFVTIFVCEGCHDCRFYVSTVMRFTRLGALQGDVIRK